MKNQVVTQCIVLSRTNFQEADRIVKVLTPDHGKVALMVKGARRVKSKLAGGIELFSISDITFIPGRKEVGTLVSSRLRHNFGRIVSNVDGTMLGYELLKRINRATEDAAGQEYFVLLSQTLSALNENKLDLRLIELWFTMQLLKITGHSPKLQVDLSGKALSSGQDYVFSYDDMCFNPLVDGPFAANHIKLLRLGIGVSDPVELLKIESADKYLPDTLQLAKTMLSSFVRV